MYLADVAIWLGWALFYGSILVLLATFCFAALLGLVMVPSEERRLLERFGNKYHLYTTSVPRWLGRRQTSP
jgi:protein-S-isoprenylcysteine O-methyltransferase Ste14